MWKIINCNPKFNGSEYSMIEYTDIQIMNDIEYTIISRRLKGDYTKESDEKLIELALESFYQEFFPNRAENEKFSEFKKMMEVMKKEFSEEMTKMKLAFAELVESNVE